MIIGAITGFAIYSILTIFVWIEIENNVREHNSSKLKVLTHGPASFKIEPLKMIVVSGSFTSIGALIGYFF